MQNPSQLVNANLVRIDKGSRPINEVHFTKPKSGATPSEQNKSKFVPTSHHCGVVDQIVYA